MSRPVGERIRELRRSCGMTQTMLATQAGISQSELCRIEKGQRSITVARLSSIAQALKVSASSLLDDRIAA